jgi:hypothetical protein
MQWPAERTSHAPADGQVNLCFALCTTSPNPSCKVRRLARTVAQNSVRRRTVLLSCLSSAVLRGPLATTLDSVPRRPLRIRDAIERSRWPQAGQRWASSRGGGGDGESVKWPHRLDEGNRAHVASIDRTSCECCPMGTRVEDHRADWAPSSHGLEHHTACSAVARSWGGGWTAARHRGTLPRALRAATHGSLA